MNRVGPIRWMRDVVALEGGTASRIAVAGVIAMESTNRDQHGWFKATESHVAGQAKVHRDTARATLNWLAEAGLLDVRRTVRSGRWVAKEYRLKHPDRALLQGMDRALVQGMDRALLQGMDRALVQGPEHTGQFSNGFFRNHVGDDDAPHAAEEEPTQQKRNQGGPVGPANPAGQPPDPQQTQPTPHQLDELARLRQSPLRHRCRRCGASPGRPCQGHMHQRTQPDTA